ncbi:hypothetical protein Scep_026750 [Stephania cephalantha]|uniref:Uncharacterized protein n=1 Tax=Stephania cephalantha TaxID=152367 RepID=A0AAP0HSW1_9MAGN
MHRPPEKPRSETEVSSPAKKFVKEKSGLLITEVTDDNCIGGGSALGVELQGSQVTLILEEEGSSNPSTPLILTGPNGQANVERISNLLRPESRREARLRVLEALIEEERAHMNDNPPRVLVRATSLGQARQLLSKSPRPKSIVFEVRVQDEPRA